MKCVRCGSSWESKQNMDRCPFCGEPIKICLEQETLFSDTIKKVINQHGVEILKEKKFISILKDYAPNENKKNELMNIFVTKNVGKKFVEMYFDNNSEWGNIYDYCVRCLKEDAFISHEYACMIMEEIGDALNLTCQVQDNFGDKTQETDKESTIKIDKEDNQEKDGKEHLHETKKETATSNFGFEINNGVLEKYNGKATKVVIPKRVTEIGVGAFMGNEHLRSIKYNPLQIKKIGDAAFFGCSNLLSINDSAGIKFGEGLETIGNFAFQKCESIKSVSFPASLKLIGAYAFYDCDSLNSITFDSTQVMIKGEAFKKCSCLRNIEMDEMLFAKYCDCFEGDWGEWKLK